MSRPNIAQNLALVRDRLAQACAEAGRSVDQVRLLAASKGVEPVRVQAAIAAGQTLLGESRAHELRSKAAAISAPVEWHFIGHLQRNKARWVVGTASLIHTLHSLELAQVLHRRRALLQDQGRALPPVSVLIAVNLGGEANKSGVAPEAALDLCQAAHALDGVDVRGLMAIPPWSPDPEAAAPWFAHLGQLAAKGKKQGLNLDELSMGMSHDFHVAVRHGATLVRVGTAIFGPRD